MRLMSVLIFIVCMVAVHSRCKYTQRGGGNLPYAVDEDSFAINYTMTVCKQYIGDEVCCNQANAKLTEDNLKQLDGVFSTASGGCDVCAINLKRFWCQYACSPRQSEFLNVSQGYYVYPDPTKPGSTLVAQEANLTVEANTACVIYNSCKRVPFVAQVSAMGSPAGFLNFQGHNAINNALQYISVTFTFDPTKGLYFSNETGKEKTAQITACNFNSSYELHGFPITEFCSCNSCEESCDISSGFQYTQPDVLEDFHYVLVSYIWGGVILVTGGLTLFRFIREKRKTA